MFEWQIKIIIIFNVGIFIASATIHQSIKRKDYPGVLHKPNNKPGEDTHSFEFFASY